MKAMVLAIGDELVGGRTVDTNSAYLSERLAARGIRTVAHVTVADDCSAIADAVADAARRADVVLITGGLGPTEDDLTRQGLADAMGVELVLNEACLAEIEAFFRQRGREMAPTNRIQAMLPAGAQPLDNRLGTAPGIAATLGGSSVFVMPGVPHEMREMFDTQIVSRLPDGAGAIVQHIVHTYGQGESAVGTTIHDLMRRDANPTVGTTVASGVVSVRVTAHAESPERADAVARETVAEVRRRLGELVIGENDDTAASVVGAMLRQRGQTVATAESCTGGLIGEQITDVPGASEYFLGGAVCYANAAKRDVLGVDEHLLAEHGAVSEPVAEAMAAGCRERFDSDWAVATTGIAGPTGGTESKPVGLVYISLAGPDGTQVHRHVFSGTRKFIRLQAALAAINYLRLALRG